VYPGFVRVLLRLEFHQTGSIRQQTAQAFLFPLPLRRRKGLTVLENQPVDLQIAGVHHDAGLRTLRRHFVDPVDILATRLGRRQFVSHRLAHQFDWRNIRWLYLSRRLKCQQQ